MCNRFIFSLHRMCFSLAMHKAKNKITTAKTRTGKRNTYLLSSIPVFSKWLYKKELRGINGSLVILSHPGHNNPKKAGWKATGLLSLVLGDISPFIRMSSLVGSFRFISCCWDNYSCELLKSHVNH